MNNGNICKFSAMPENPVCEITPINFVLEKTDVEKEERIRSVYRIHVVTQGRGVFTCDKRGFDVEKGDVFFAFPGSLFSIKGDSDLEYAYISFLGLGAPALIRRIMPVIDGYKVFKGHEDLIPIWKKALKMTNNKNVDLVAKGVLELSASALIVIPPSVQERDVISKIECYVRENFSLPITLKDIAAKFGYNEKYLSKLFREKTGMYFKDYLLNLRINAACGIMELKTKSVKEIAIECGFPDPLYFSKVFRKKMGVSPSEFKSGK